jgi:hypothetical protein
MATNWFRLPERKNPAPRKDAGFSPKHASSLLDEGKRRLQGFERSPLPAEMSAF